eukprot:EG_transcript_12621
MPAMIPFLLGGMATFGGLFAVCHHLSYRPGHVQLRGAHVVITGGSSGIGLALAALCLKEGASHVAIVGSTQSRLNAALAELEGTKTANQQISGILHDVSLPSVIQALAEHTSKFGDVDILVTSAGITTILMFEDLEPEVFERTMRVNFLGTVYAIKGVLPGMKRRSRGRIIMLSSMAGQAGLVGYAVYSPTKFAVRGLAETLAMELCPFGIGVSVCNPPNVDTPMYEGEIKIKPLASTLVDAGSGLMTANRIAEDIVNHGIKQYSFFIQSGFDGVMLGLGTIGMGPASSAWRILAEVFSMGLIRLVQLFYLRYFYEVCRRCAKAEPEAQRAKQE